MTKSSKMTLAAICEPERERSQLERFKDLESDICDLRNMSILLELAVSDMWQQKIEEEQRPGYSVLRLVDDQVNSIYFAVNRLELMARQLSEKFFEAFEEGRKTNDD